MSAAQDSGPRRGLLPRFTLKDGDTFLLADALGDIHDPEDGLFTDDTRMLSKFELSVANRPAETGGGGAENRAVGRGTVGAAPGRPHRCAMTGRRTRRTRIKKAREETGAGSGPLPGSVAAKR